MNKTRFPQSKIRKILKEHDDGSAIKDLLKKYGISMATFYNWRKKYGNIHNADSSRVAYLEEENERLKRMFAELSLENLSLRKKLQSDI
jgi:putative transposase